MKLVSIDGFKLYATFTPDSMLVDAINKKYGEECVQFAFSTKACSRSCSDDLMISSQTNNQKVVCNLFGKIDIKSTFAITAEDVMEYIIEYQRNCPDRLINKLSSKTLLFIGCGSPDWLVPFIVRNSKNDRLSNSRGSNKMEYIIDDQYSEDNNVIKFLKLFSVQTKILNIDPVEFINELYRRWIERKTLESAEMPYFSSAKIAGKDEKYVFISYYHEDRENAQKIVDALIKSGIGVWFDSRLRGGDEYDTIIKEAIKNAVLFIPILSNNTINVKQGYFRKEWILGIDRATYFGGSTQKYIMPIVIDNSDIYGSSEIHEKIKACISIKAINGEISKEDIDEIENNYKSNQS